MSDTAAMQLPLLPLRDVVVYPHMVLPLFVGRERSIEALEHAMSGNKQVLLVAQRHAPDDNPDVDDLYQVGTISTILQLLKLPDGTIKVLVEGSERAAIEAIDTGETFSMATVREVVCEDLESADADGAAAAATPIAHEGLLQKQGGVRKNWKKRYFVLRHGFLSYFSPDKVRRARFGAIAPR